MLDLLDRPGMAFAVVAVFAFAAVALWELRRPLLPASEHLNARWRGNFGLFVVNHALGYLTAPLAAALTAVLAARWGLGLLPWLDAGPLAAFVVTLLALDLARWAAHRLMHGSALLWRIHHAHHSDREFDCTVGARFHPLEVLLHAMLVALVVFALGAALPVVVAAEALVIAHNFFCHANAGLPPAVERRLRHVVVTPDLHRVHHSLDAGESNHNYGTVFPWWDRLAGTLLLPAGRGPHAMRFGVEDTAGADSRSLWRLLLRPLRPQAVR